MPPPVATITWRSGWRSFRISRSTVRKYGSPCVAKISRDRAALAALDELVDVFGPPAQPRRQRAGDRALAARHEADEVNLVGRHWTSLARSSSNEGYDTATASAPAIDRWARRAERDEREGHHQPMIARRIDLAARRAPAPVDDESVGPLLGKDPHRSQACHERRDPVTLFHAQLGRARDFQRASKRRTRRQHRQLVDQARNLLGGDHGRQMVVVDNLQSADRLPGHLAGDFNVDSRAHAFERAQEPQPVRVEGHAFDAHAGPREGRCGRCPDRRRGRIARDGQERPRERWAVWPPSTDEIVWSVRMRRPNAGNARSV